MVSDTYYIVLDDVLKVDFFYSIQPDIPWGIWITTNSLILLYYVCGMYKSNSNFGAGCPNWADWADLRFGFVHSTDIIEQNKSVYHNQDTSMHIWWIGIKKLFLKHHLVVHIFAVEQFFSNFRTPLWSHFSKIYYLYQLACLTHSIHEYKILHIIY